MGRVMGIQTTQYEFLVKTFCMDFIAHSPATGLGSFDAETAESYEFEENP